MEQPNVWEWRCQQAQESALYLLNGAFTACENLTGKLTNELVLKQIDLGYRTLEATMPGQNRRVDRAKQALARFPT